MSRRMNRVGEAIKEALGEVIQRHLKDPRVGFVTITGVSVTPDLAKADVYYTVLGETKEIADTRAGLESATPFLRTETGRRVRLKNVPELIFHLDDTPAKAQRVDSILDDIHKEHAMDAGMHLTPLPADVDATMMRAVETLDGAGSVAVACHVAPDGDALGSILAVAQVLHERGVTLQVGWDGEDTALPAQLDFLPGAELLTPAEKFRPPEVTLAIDCANADRLGRLWERLQKAGAVINIDHHVSNSKFGAINVVDTGATSSAELICHLLVKMGAAITPEVATCLYTGLVTDAGRFGYAGVSPRTHATAAFLIQRGVDVSAVSQALYESFRFPYLKILGRVLERAELNDDPPFVWSYLTQADLADCGVTMDDTDEVINTLRGIRDRDVAVILKELEPGSWKGSFRSRGATDVGEVAGRLDGGGHALAAGFNVSGTVDEAIATVRAALTAG